MTRINTNVSSLNAQKTLAKNQASLNQAMTRLSTGLRINSGADDPSGMIAAAIQSNDIAAMKTAITNTQNGSMLISTADSALGQITNLLTDIRGLVTQVTNTAVVNSDMIAANQLQVDSALQAIDRISQVTKFQGQSILDGTLDFINNSQTVPQITNLNVTQANLGTTGTLEVAVSVAAHAEKADITTSSEDTYANATVKFAARAHCVITDSTGANQRLDIVANSNSSNYSGVSVVFNTGAAAHSAAYNADTKVLTVNTVGAGTLMTDIVSDINGTGVFTAVSQNVAATTFTSGVTTAMSQDQFTLTAVNKGTAYNDVKVNFASSATPPAATPAYSWNAATKELTITVNNGGTYAGGTTLANLESTLNADAVVGALFQVSASTATGRIYGALTSDTAAIANTSETGYLKSSFSAATRATATLTMAAGATLYSGSGARTMDIKATSLDGTYNDVTVSLIADAGVAKGAEYAKYDAGAKTLKVYFKAGTVIGDTLGSTMTQIAAAINSSTDSNGNATGAWKAMLTTSDAAGLTSFIASPATFTTSQDTVSVQSLNAGANFNNMQVQFETVSAAPAGGALASYDATSNIFKIQVKYGDAVGDQVTLQQISNAISAVSGFSGSYTTKNAVGTVSQSSGVVFGKSVDASAVGNSGSTGGNTLLGDLTVEIGANDGQQVFTWKRGAGANEVAAAINAVSDAIGATASFNNDLVHLMSSKYGAKGFISLNVISEAGTGTFKTGVSSFRETGTDANATINGIQASSDGNTLSINTSSLAMNMDVLAETNGSFNFSITGGGAQFQLGPDVVSNQQLRIGIQSVNTARLGGATGKLYQLAQGNNADLDTNPNLAAKIVDEAGTAVTTLRGRLGAIQGLTMLTNQNTLEDMVQNMETSLSLIQDTDFAAETANLTRAQILTQANMSVLSIANQQPQQVLSLLPRG
jgi:flagellin